MAALAPQPLPTPLDVLSNNKEVVFDLDAAAFSSDEFRMYHFKASKRGRAPKRRSGLACSLGPHRQTIPPWPVPSQVKRCPRARPHDWTQCPFAHPGEKAKRRDPRKYRYSGTACPEFRRVRCFLGCIAKQPRPPPPALPAAVGMCLLCRPILPLPYRPHVFAPPPPPALTERLLPARRRVPLCARRV